MASGPLIGDLVIMVSGKLFIPPVREHVRGERTQLIHLPVSGS